MNTTTLIFDGRVYSVEILQKAAYRLINQCAITFSLEMDSIKCEIFVSKNPSPERFEALEEEFKKEVLDQSLRAKIATETEGIRNLILSVAFSNTGLQDLE